MVKTEKTQANAVVALCYCQPLGQRRNWVLCLVRLRWGRKRSFMLQHGLTSSYSVQQQWQKSARAQSKLTYIFL